MQKKNIMTLKQLHSESDLKHVVQPGGLPNIRLDDIQIFVEVARQGSVRKAATVLEKTPALVNRRIKLFEHEIGHELFVRSNNGSELTDEGRALYQTAQSFVTESSNVLGFINQQIRHKQKTSSLVVTEGLGTFWLMPRLVEFSQNFPDIFLDVQCEMKPANLSDYSADIAVQLDYPEDENLIVSRIGYLHIMMFASVDYKNRNGIPQNLNELMNHNVIEQRSHQVDARKYVQNLQSMGNNPVSMRMNTSSAHAYAIARGAGIGPLPTYARAITKKLMTVCDDYHIRREIYLVQHKDTAKSAHQRKVLEWLRSAFNAKKYPWFAEEFIHPNEFEESLTSGNIVQMFDGFDE